MKQILTLSILILSLISCAQDKQKKESKIQKKMRPIIELYANAKKLNYKSEPIYVMKAQQSGCFYEIYVNDILVSKLYKNVTRIGNIVDLNDVILKSGTQKVTIKLFPPTGANGKLLKKLYYGTHFELEIRKYDKKRKGNEVSVKDYFAPTTTGKKDGPFKYAGTPYFEDTFTFEAEVPYSLKGWSESQDLTKLDKEVLEKEVLAFYAEYDKVIQSQNEKKWVAMVRNKEQEYFKSVAYNDKNDTNIKRRIKEYNNVFDNESIGVEPLDTYKMIFGGDGKVVTLKSINPENSGESAYSFGLKADVYGDGKRYDIQQFYYLHLHKPKGSTKLEIIR